MKNITLMASLIAGEALKYHQDHKTQLHKNPEVHTAEMATKIAEQICAITGEDPNQTISINTG